MIYYFFMTYLVAINQLAPKSLLRTNLVSHILIVLMYFIMVFVLLLNPLSNDMLRYLEVLNNFSTAGLLEAWSEVRWEPGFVLYQWLIANITTSNVIFILLSLAIIWILLIGSLRKIIKVTDLPLIILGYLSFFYFYNFTSNVLRQGFAMPLILFMLTYLNNSNYLKAIIMLVSAAFFHISAIIASVLFLIKKVNVSLNLLILMYFFSAILMLTGLNEFLLSNVFSSLGGIIGETSTRYVSEEASSNYGATNRIDFLIFTSIWVLWAWLFHLWYLKKDSLYLWLFKSYIALSIIYILFGFIAYSDRLAAYAWFLIPLLIFYPVTRMVSIHRNFWFVIGIIVCIGMFFYFEVSPFYEPLKLFY